MDSVTKVYFSYCYPYSYTRVHRLVRAVEARIAEKQGDSNNSNYLDAGVTMLGKSIAGNNIEAITLGTRGKPLLLIMARAHPSETVASFVMEGVVRMLMSEEVEARFLLEQCRVLLVPMLNPDGVVHGNSRSSYAGCDLNRRWVKPMKELQPEILAVKRYIRKLLGEC
jgi:murein tripeptide amidase MpaA